MKKIVISLLIIFSIILIIIYLYFNKIVQHQESKKENIQFEVYKEKEMYGTDLTSLINQAIDSNKKNGVEKDNKGKYKDNGTNSINIDIKFLDNDITYNMETVYQSGMDNFLSYYRDIKFKCTNIKYHTSTNHIKYMLIEQITQ